MDQGLQCESGSVSDTSESYYRGYHFLIVDVIDEVTVQFRAVAYDDAGVILDESAVSKAAHRNPAPRFPPCKSEGTFLDFRIVPWLVFGFITAAGAAIGISFAMRRALLPTL